MNANVNRSALPGLLSQVRKLAWCVATLWIILAIVSVSFAQQSYPWETALKKQLRKLEETYGDRPLEIVVVHLGIGDRDEEAEKIATWLSAELGYPVIALPSYSGDPADDIKTAVCQYYNKNYKPVHIAKAWEKILSKGYTIVGVIFHSGAGICANNERDEISACIRENLGKIRGTFGFVETCLEGLTKKVLKKVGIKCVPIGRVGAVTFVTTPTSEYVPFGGTLSRIFPVGLVVALFGVPVKSIASIPAAIDFMRGLPNHSLERRLDKIRKALGLKDRKALALKDNRELESSVRDTGKEEVGVEAGPVLSRVLTPALLGVTEQLWRSAIDMDDLLPTSGPSGTKVVGPLSVPRTLREGAIASRAIEFRTEPSDNNTTKAVVMIMKTKIEEAEEDKVYRHDYGICRRFHLDTLDTLEATPVSRGATEASGSDPVWFWFCRVYNNRLETFEEACQFVAFVSESRRQITVDSRWIGKQYSPHWHDPQKTYDYVLNFQIWAYSADETLKLLRSVLSRLDELGDSWKVTFANQQEPIQPTAFVEEAWYTGGTVYLSVLNCLSSRRMAYFHGTKQYHLMGKDEVFEYWAPLYPGRNFLELPIGRIHNAVIHCELDGFIDKVFVSVNRQQPAPSLQYLQRVVLQEKPPEDNPTISISWPSANARVAVLRDQLDMPGPLDRVGLVAINGTFSNAPVGSSIIAFVHTDKWYLQEQKVAVHGDLWGTRVYLAGQENNKHWISVGIYKDGKELARHEVGPIYRLDPVPGDAPRGVQQLPQAPLQDIIVDADKWKGDGGVHRWPDGCITIGGGPDGPHNRGGTAWCQVDLPVDASTLKLKMSIWHGLETQEGKGVHSRVAKGTVTVFVNDVQVHTIVCQHRHKFGDFWPEDRAELGRELPEMDLRIKGITGKSLTIKLVASPWTCMDLRTFNVKPVPRSALLDQNTAPQPTLQE